MSEKTLTWRELLGQLIEDPGERQRIAEVANVHQMTLQRWASGASAPRPTSFHALLTALPHHRELLQRLLAMEFPEFPLPVEQALAPAPSWQSPSIPLDFYDRVLLMSASVLPTSRFWKICNLVLQQALTQLDPDRRGMALTIVQCVPPATGSAIRCLRQSVELGTPPWRDDLAGKTYFLGAESLAGYAATSGITAVVQSVGSNPGRLPARRIDHEESIVACPLYRSGAIAGCLTAASARPNHFTDARIALTESYARLLCLAFGDPDFYAPGAIDLRVMAPYQLQQARLSTFRERVNLLLREAGERQASLSLPQAECIVRQQFAEEFMLAPSPIEHRG